MKDSVTESLESVIELLTSMGLALQDGSMGHSRALAKVLVALRLPGSYPSSVLSFVGI
jgi:hypothetical protein